MDLLRPETLFTIVCRPALPRDTPEVMEFTRKIWEGTDYIPLVWDDWLRDPLGLLAVAEYGGRVVGLCKLTRQQPGEWWLEGMRVHPQYEGRGFAAHMHEYMLETWRRLGGGVLRLATASYQEKIHHLCERTAFRKIAEFTAYTALSSDMAQRPVAAHEKFGFEPLRLDEVTRAVDFARYSPVLEFSGGLMDVGWQWAKPSEKYFKDAVRREQAFWWRSERGLLLCRLDTDEQQVEVPVIQLAACVPGDLADMLVDYHHLAAAWGYSKAGWVVSTNHDYLSILGEAGFRREWDFSLFIYEKGSL